MAGDEPTPIGGPVRFSTEMLPARDRLEIWREEFGRKIVRLDMAPLDDDPLFYDAAFQSVGDVSVSRGEISAISCARDRSLLNDGNGDVVMLIPENTTLRVEQGRFDETLDAGDCLVRRSSEVGRTLSKAGTFMTLNLPVERLAERVADIDLLLGTVVPSDSDALRLLLGYSRMVLGETVTLSPATVATVQEHLLDLAALAIGANRDAWHIAQDRGLRAARRMVVHVAIRKNATNRDYRIGDLARDMRASESYIRKLLAEVDETFSSLLLAARLERAMERLTAPGSRRLKIAEVAIDCGFGDISYFNRSFLRRFGMNPTEARKAG